MSNSNNNELLTLSGIILGVGVVLIIAVVMLFTDASKNAPNKSTSNQTTKTTTLEDINTKVASLAEPQKALVLQGNELFQGNCAQCHAIDKKVVGPALKDVTSRWSNETEIINFIKYPEKVITGGKNEYVTKLYKEYGQIMPNHDFFSDEQIQSILTYIKFESGEKIAMK